MLSRSIAAPSLTIFQCQGNQPRSNISGLAHLVAIAVEDMLLAAAVLRRSVGPRLSIQRSAWRLAIRCNALEKHQNRG
ncbi:MAG: hypothetical protein M2R45_01725 [Verrucomicrobia subdivision 3 bacterium]|nr:hypothetical protein [Limisphaerales bacterium]MCS1413462.1 hypothetical protein [Limisphaerales bacterium]